MLLQKVVPSESLVIETAGTSEMSVLIHRQRSITFQKVAILKASKESKFILIFSFHLCPLLQSSFFHLRFLIKLYALLGLPEATNWHLSTLLHSIITQKMVTYRTVHRTVFHPTNTACSIISYFSFHHPNHISAIWIMQLLVI